MQARMCPEKGCRRLHSIDFIWYFKSSGKILPLNNYKACKEVWFIILIYYVSENINL